VLFCSITSHVKDEPYPNLHHEKDGAGFPYVCFLDKNGHVVAKQRAGAVRDDGVEAFATTLTTQVKAFYDLEKAAKSGDKKAKAEFFMQRFDLGHLAADDLQAAVKAPSFLTKDQLALVQERLMELRVKSCLEGLDQTKKETFGPYAKKLLQLHKSIGLPEGPAGINPWYVILEDAYGRGDAKVFEMAFTALCAAGLGSRKVFVDKRRKQLAELKARTKK
jgi:hypothetical protein